MASRFGRYLRRLAGIALALAIVALVLAAIQAAYHPFDAALARLAALTDDLDSRMSREAFKGITIGSLALLLALCVFPLFLRRIDEKAYARGLWRGVVAAAVYYLSSRLFEAASSLGRIRLIMVMIVAIVAGAIVVEGISLAVREENEKSFRTDVVASIASGFLFGVLVKLGGYGLEFLERTIASLHR